MVTREVTSEIDEIREREREVRKVDKVEVERKLRSVVKRKELDRKWENESEM